MYFFQVLANMFFILSMSASCISASAVFCASMSNSTSTLSLSRLFSSCRLAFSRRRRSWSTVPGPELKRLVMDNSDQLIVTLTLAGVIMSTTFCGRQRKSGRLFFRDLLLWCTRIILVDASHWRRLFGELLAAYYEGYPREKTGKSNAITRSTVISLWLGLHKRKKKWLDGSRLENLVFSFHDFIASSALFRFCFLFSVSLFSLSFFFHLWSIFILSNCMNLSFSMSWCLF